MLVLKHTVYAAILLGITSHAFAVDLATYPTSYLGDVKNVNAALAKGTVVCSLKGRFYSSGNAVNYSGHVKLTHDGIKDINGFGHFTSPLGKESFVQYSVPYTMSNGSGGFIEGGFTCVQALNITTSKYAVNKFGKGISELHWDADPDNVSKGGNCSAFIDQMGWVVDKTGHTITTKINEAPTTIMGEQSVDCYKSN